MKWLWAAALLFVVLGAPSVASAQTAPGASADVRTNTGQALATATFTQAPDAVLVSLKFPDRTALVGTHAVQIHTGDQCVSGNPVIADLSDLVISPAGVSVYNLSTGPNVALTNLLGTSLMVYAEGADNPGQPIACGVIQGGTARSDSVTAIVIGALGGLLLAGGIVLRRGA